MTCESIHLGNGVSFIGCGPKKKPKPCETCGEASSKLCDYKLTGKRAGKTCGAAICARCAVSIGPDEDLCPTHDRFVKAIKAQALASSARRQQGDEEAAAIEAAYKANLNDRWLAELVSKLDVDKLDADEARAVELARNPSWPFPVDDSPIPNSMKASGSVERTAMRNGTPMTIVVTVDPDGFLPELAPEPPPWEVETSRVDADPHAWFCPRYGIPNGIGLAVACDCGEAKAKAWAPKPGDTISDSMPVPSSHTFPRESIGAKVEHVRAARQTRNHTCHWPGCEEQVKPAVWGCRTHWYKLPKKLRDKIWNEYRSGQEVTLTPSRGYLAAAREVEGWILANHPPVGSAQSDRNYAAAAIERISYQEAVEATRESDATRRFRNSIRDERATSRRDVSPVALIVDTFELGDAASDIVTRHDANENDPRDPREGGDPFYEDPLNGDHQAGDYPNDRWDGQ